MLRWWPPPGKRYTPPDGGLPTSSTRPTMHLPRPELQGSLDTSHPLRATHMPRHTTGGIGLMSELSHEVSRHRPHTSPK